MARLYTALRACLTRASYPALVILGALLTLFDWHRLGASWRESIFLTFRFIRPLTPISGGADTQFYSARPGAPASAPDTNPLSVVLRWSRQIWIELPKLIYWNKFMSDGLNTIIQTKKDLENQPGDRVKFDFIRKLADVGKREGAVLEGQEEAMVVHQDEVILLQKRNAVRLNGRLSERSTAWDQRNAAKELLTTWMAERIDADIFGAFDIAPSNAIWGGSATSKATIQAGDFMTTALLTRAKTKAKKMGGATDWKIWPVKIGNKEYYVCIIHPEQEHDLKVHDAAWAQAQREAQVRGDENPLFEGSVGVWDQVIVHTHENISVGSDYGPGAPGVLPGAQAQFFGRQAGAFAWGARPNWVEKEFEYGDKTGFAIGAIYGTTKAVFDSKDHAFISIGTNRTQV